MKIKKILTVVLSALMLLSSAPLCSFVKTVWHGSELELSPLFATEASAANYDGMTCEISNGKVTITYCDTSKTGKLVIPENIDGFPVTSIGNYAFENCGKITEAEIPNSVTDIGDLAFYNCTSLVNINIPDSVTKIGSSAFNGCTSLESVKIGIGVTNITYDMFYFCDSLESITISSGNSHYDSRNDCNAIIETETNTLIYGCKNTVIPNSVVSIGGWAFGDCKSITDITIPKGITGIGCCAFLCCTGLTDIIIPSSVTYIHNEAFSGCNGVESITVSSENPYYDSRNNCNAIIDTESDKLIFGCKNTVIPDGIASIGNGAFSGCIGLTNITIPDSIKAVGGGAFNGCDNLTSVHISDIKSWCKISFGDRWSNPLNYAKHLFSGKNEITDLVIPDGVNSIGNYQFCGCAGLTGVTIPDSVTIIGDEAFSECINLKKAAIPNSVTDVGVMAFYCCSSLSGAEIPNGVKNIGSEAFEHCVNLKSVKLPESITIINAGTFADCTGLTSVMIPGSVEIIDGGAFDGCISLMSVSIPDSVTTIGYGAFYGCRNLISIAIPGSVTSISKYTFTGCNKNLNVYCYKESYAQSFCLKNKINYVLVNILPKSNSTIDYENKLIFTGARNITAVELLINVSSTTVAVPQASLTSGKTERFGTGSTVTVFENNVYTGDYKVIVTGDLDGDSVCDVIDASLTEKAANNMQTLSNEQICAANGCYSEEVDITSYQNVVNKALA